MADHDTHDHTGVPGVGTDVTDIVDIPTLETDTDLRLAPDGAGGVEWATGSIGDILDIPTAETDSALVLAPDGAGGVEFRAESGGSGGTYGAYTPSLSGITLNNGTIAARYTQTGKVVNCYGELTFGSGTSVGGLILIGLPVVPISAKFMIGAASTADAGSSYHRVVGVAEINTSFFGAQSFQIASAGNAGWSNTAVPSGSWGTGDLIFWNITYEAA
jgi:hypothetical protein